MFLTPGLHPAGNGEICLCFQANSGDRNRRPEKFPVTGSAFGCRNAGIMDAGERRFRWILAWVFGVFILADFAIPGISNVILESRTRRVKEGMTEQQAVEIMHLEPTGPKGERRMISWSKRSGWLEELYRSVTNHYSGSDGWMIVIKDGVVRSIGKSASFF